MKTCYGAHCIEYKDGGEFSNIVPLSIKKSFLVGITVISALFVAVALNEGLLSNFIANIDWSTNYYNLEYPINSGYDSMNSKF